MQPGSIVVVKLGSLSLTICKTDWRPIDDEKTMYTIRDMMECPVTKHMCAVFEEGVIGYNPRGMELAIKIRNLIEILPPSPLAQQLLEESPELLTV